MSEEKKQALEMALVCAFGKDQEVRCTVREEYSTGGNVSMNQIVAIAMAFVRLLDHFDNEDKLAIVVNLVSYLGDNDFLKTNIKPVEEFSKVDIMIKASGQIWSALGYT